MLFHSTRGGDANKTFEEVLMQGLADDGGLFIPKSLSRYSRTEIDSFKNFSYSDLAKKIIFPFVWATIR